MKRDVRQSAFFAAGSIVVCLTLLPVRPAAVSAFAQQAKQDIPRVVSAGEKRAIKAFEERVKRYVKLRERLEERMPKLSKEATPEQIEAHKKAFQERVRAARVGAKAGDVFVPGIVGYIRTTIKGEFKGQERAELRDTVLVESDTKGVPVRVNYPYPETKELIEMPPTLLLKLPQLPKQVRYRFVNRYLLLVDRENGLIIDYMPDALP